MKFPLLASILLVSSFLASSKGSGVVQVDNSHWPTVKAASQEFWTVAFYKRSPDFLNTFNALASEFKDSPNVKFGRVYCQTPENIVDSKSVPESSLQTSVNQNQIYTKKFYEGLLGGSLRSAREILPTVVNLVHPHSACDVGCGPGAWLRTIQDIAGINDSDIAGFDFDVPIETLVIANSTYHKVDLSKPVNYTRQFDLCISLEVAEHLAADSAEIFVKSLISLAPVVLFSAAIPGQGGTHHVNEQHINYWEALFKKYNYYPIDCLRFKFWMNKKVDLCYRQNTVLFVAENMLGPLGFTKSKDPLLSVIHPGVYRNTVLASSHKKKGEHWGLHDLSGYPSLVENTKTGKLCSDEAVEEQPIVKLFYKGRSVMYSGKLDLDALINWVKKNLTSLNESSSQQQLNSSSQEL